MERKKSFKCFGALIAIAVVVILVVVLVIQERRERERVVKAEEEARVEVLFADYSKKFEIAKKLKEATELAISKAESFAKEYDVLDANKKEEFKALVSDSRRLLNERSKAVDEFYEAEQKLLEARKALKK